MFSFCLLTWLLLLKKVKSNNTPFRRYFECDTLLKERDSCSYQKFSKFLVVKLFKKVNDTVVIYATQIFACLQAKIRFRKIKTVSNLF